MPTLLLPPLMLLTAQVTGSLAVNFTVPWTPTLAVRGEIVRFACCVVEFEPLVDAEPFPPPHAERVTVIAARIIGKVFLIFAPLLDCLAK